MSKLILVRHGASVWNLENRFTGWIDIPLASVGEVEAKEAGRRLREATILPTHAFTSKLVRARSTLDLMLHELGITLPIESCQELNERHYGKLQGMNKDEMARHFGAEQVRKWRRSFTERPPDGESLEDTARRVLLCYDSKICPLLRKDAKALVVAHHNSLRALVMHLEGISPEKIPTLELPTGVPMVYNLDGAFQIISRTTL